VREVERLAEDVELHTVEETAVQAG
jgi:hypothetical protein